MKYYLILLYNSKYNSNYIYKNSVYIIQLYQQLNIVVKYITIYIIKQSTLETLGTKINIKGIVYHITYDIAMSSGNTSLYNSLLRSKTHNLYNK